MPRVLALPTPSLLRDIDVNRAEGTALPRMHAPGADSNTTDEFPATTISFSVLVLSVVISDSGGEVKPNLLRGTESVNSGIDVYDVIVVGPGRRHPA
jgi:hypothetical protein